MLHLEALKVVEKQVPWVYWMWCMAHRLELAIKDALKGTSFDLVDEMLLRLYYIYDKSAKKCRELEGIVSDLKDCFQFDDDGVRPLRASGSRWVCHKLNAMRRVLSKYGAYTSHLATLSEDSSVKSTDREKLKGYIHKWTNAKYLLGCAIFIDVLTPCAIFSKTMQSDTLDILGALTCLIRTTKETNKLSSKPLEQWSTYSSTLQKISEDAGEPVYQCQSLKSFPQAKHHYENNYATYCSKVNTCIKARMQWSDLQIIRDIIFVLGTQGWQKLLDKDQDISTLTTEPSSSTAIIDVDQGDDFIDSELKAIDRLVERFEFLLQSAGADTDLIKPEFEALLSYAGHFIQLSTNDYQSVWWRIFHSPNCNEWTNLLVFIQLLFALPASNGKIERVFSQLNVIKTDKRTALSNDTMYDLLVIKTNKYALKDFSPDSSIRLWWEAKTRRPNQHKRKRYAVHKKPSGSSITTSSSTISLLESDTTSTKNDADDETDSDDEEERSNAILLDDWDRWMNDEDQLIHAGTDDF